MTFGEKLQRLRKEQNWTQEELAEKLMVSRQALSNWESGAAIPDTENVIQISRLFGVSIDYLLNDAYQKEEDVSPSNPNGPRHNVFKWNPYFKILAGIYIVGISLLVLLSLCILGFDFFRFYNCEWLFIVCLIVCIAGILLVFGSMICKGLKQRKWNTKNKE